jgi:hypothetical protein
MYGRPKKYEETMSNCCPAEPVGSPVRIAECRQCGRPGKPVGTLTLKHMVKPAFLDVVSEPGFLFCASPDCDVVYFHPDGQELRRDDLRIPVGLKGAQDAPLCYCFGFTQAMVEEELRARGDCAIVQRITAEVKAGNCACEVRNPQGSCCLGNVTAVVKRLKSGEPNSKPLQAETANRSSLVRNRILLRLLSRLAIFGAGIFGAAEVVQPFYRSDRRLSDPYSSYVSGKYGFVQTIAFVALSIGSLALSLALSKIGQSEADWRAGRALLTVWSIGVLVAAVFPLEGGLLPGSANIHGLASMLSFLSILTSMLVFSRAFGRNEGWQRFAFWSWLFALVAAASFVLAAAIHHPACFAVFQRLFLGAIILWITASAVLIYCLGHD